ncbi:MAG: hypothetical protein B6226_05015 [Candidatus Cloacimonetes bacterium 4572_65]|nr:MAG: hypothetical protein B6226_05015 [Candidatus Cloacimonetes bacterium 4572_65]
MTYFKEMSLNEKIQKALETIEFVSPTPIQEKAIPFILENKQDLVALAQTGTGKTAAFGLPILNLVDTDSKKVQAFILCPTRELCLQITKDLQRFAQNMRGVNIVSVYGGASIQVQLRELRQGANIVVGTPGRVNDFVKRGNDPHEISSGSKNAGAETVSHFVYTVRAKDKYSALKRIADMNPKIYAIVFCRTRRDTQEIAEKLQFDGYNADAIHGDLSQVQRETVMGKFRNKHIQLLVATDVAARGIDINDLTHVINYGLPDETDIYIHRSGRTGRAGKTGISITIAHSKDGRKIKQIERRLGKDMTHSEVPSGREICEKQLLNLIDVVEKVEVKDDINPFMDVIFKKLEWLEREELIKHFVAVEFNKFLEYYKYAKDINYHKSDRDYDRYSDRGERGGRRDRYDRDGRRGSRESRFSRDRDRGGRFERGGRDDRSSRFDRSDRGSNRGDRYDRNDRGDRGDRYDRNDGGKRKSRAQSGYTRFFMNVGTNHEANKMEIISIINDLNIAPRLDIGRIDVKEKFSFFEIDHKFEEDIIQKFRKKVKFNGYTVRIEVAKP